MYRDVEATLERLQRQRRFDELSDELSVNYPQTYGGSWMRTGPDGRPSVRFTGAVPQQARETAKAHELAVDFKPGAKRPLSKLKSLKDHVHQAFLEHGACTSAFAVENRDTGTTGISTAGHCGPGVDRIREQDGDTYSTNGISDIWENGVTSNGTLPHMWNWMISISTTRPGATSRVLSRQVGSTRAISTAGLDSARGRRRTPSTPNQ